MTRNLEFKIYGILFLMKAVKIRIKFILSECSCKNDLNDQAVNFNQLTIMLAENLFVQS